MKLIQVIFGIIIFEENKATVQKITGIIELEDNYNSIIAIEEIAEITNCDYIINPDEYDGEIIYECPKLIHVNE